MVAGSVKNCFSDAKQGGMCWQDLKDKIWSSVVSKGGSRKEC